MNLKSRFSLTHRRITHEVLCDGEGPPVVVLHEQPEMTQACLKLASRVVRYGYRVYVPLLFGLPDPAPDPAAGRSHGHVPTSRYHIRHEFNLLTADKSSPLTEWLLELSRIAHRQTGQRTEGVVGMCLTDSSVVSVMLDPAARKPRPSPPAITPLLFLALFSTLASAQSAIRAAPALLAPPPLITLNCPGSFPTNLTVLNCSYTQQDRRLQFVSSSVTDEAMLQSIIGSLITSAFPSTNTNPITLKYYGLRVGASYSASVARGATEYAIGTLMHDDPRHTRCVDDPRVFLPDPNDLFNDHHPGKPEDYRCTPGKRFFHVLIDTFTVRRSRPGVIPYTRESDPPYTKEDYDRLTPDQQNAYRSELKSIRRYWPALDRFAGVYAGAYAQYPWEPQASNSFAAASQRAALSFSATLLGSLYTEYASSLFKRRSKSLNATRVHP